MLRTSVQRIPKSLTDKEGALAETTEELVASEEGLKNTKLDFMATDKALSGFHGECDWLLKHFDARAEARTGEIEALG